MWGAPKFDGPYCPCCMSKINDYDDNMLHHCLVYINGLPAAGDNHLKSIFDFEHYATVK